MRLFVVRHGIAADPADFKGPDGSRPLTGKGRKRFKRTAKAFARQDTPAHIFTSPLVRAVQTAELLARGCGTDEVEVLEELLPDGPPAKLLAAVHARLKKGESAALVGHDPQLTLLVAHLAGTSKDLELMKGAIVCVELPSLPEPKGAVVQWTLWPKEKEPRDGPPIVKSEKELAAEAAAAEEKKRAKKAEKKAAHEKKKAEKEAAKAQKRHEKEAHAKAREIARQRAAQKRKQKTKEARPPAGSAKGPDPKRRVAKPRRSLPVRSVPAAKPPPAPAPKIERPKRPAAKPPSVKPATAKPPVQIVKPVAPPAKPVAPPKAVAPLPKPVAPKPVAPKPAPQAAKLPSAPTPASPPAQVQPKSAPASATPLKPAEPAPPKPAPAEAPDDGSSE
ncbi:MAG: histidine phosphatase family protein [Deltaproteobacteria bacterium]|nr:histidine phosphatase family protein [Deltaproteobacteria bacterium]